MKIHVTTFLDRHGFKMNHVGLNIVQKQPSNGVSKKRYSENMQQIYKRTPIPKYDFNKAKTVLKITLGRLHRLVR